MTILSAIKLIFEIRGVLSGYKTYVGLTATILAVTAGFLTNQVIPWMDGGVDTVAFVKSLPGFIAVITGAWTAGAMRHAIEKGA
jgi:hypothetical protein